MPRGTGYKLENFNVGDEVRIEYMFNGEDEEAIPVHYGDFSPIGAVGIITRITGASYPFRVEFEDPEYLADTGRVRFDVFKANELSPINREPDWEV
jgi:hypothetical protein